MFSLAKHTLKGLSVVKSIFSPFYITVPTNNISHLIFSIFLFSLSNYLFLKGIILLVGGVTTQGARHTPDFVTSYRVSYSIDGQRWTIYKENGTEKVIIFLFILKNK